MLSSNTFCPTGEGGGRDNSCGKEGGGAGGKSKAVKVKKKWYPEAAKTPEQKAAYDAEIEKRTAEIKAQQQALWDKKTPEEKAEVRKQLKAGRRQDRAAMKKVKEARGYPGPLR